ncbi:MAG: hypothetical protein R2838_07815 [Caldilineaceae bacterium]
MTLIEEGVTNVNPEDRKPIYDRIQEIFVEEVPVSICSSTNG